MSLYFITGNRGKFSEVKEIIPDIVQLEIDLPEIQDLDARIVIKEKLLEATKHESGEFIVEDTSLSFDALGGLPGPLCKWFLKATGNEGLFNISQKLGNDSAQVKVILGYINNEKQIQFFERVLQGRIVTPVGDNGFGWDPIFQPDGYEKTFAEMTQEEKNQISMRKIAADKLKNYLNK
jgi:inosine triphosphate pyrophosphatase